MRKKNFEVANPEDIKRLKALIEKDPSLTQEKLAELCGWTSQGNVSNYLNGRIPLSVEAACLFAEALGVSLDEISPRLAKRVTRLFRYTEESLARQGVRKPREEIKRNVMEQRLIKLFASIPKIEQEKVMHDLNEKAKYYEQILAELLAAKDRT